MKSMKIGLALKLVVVWAVLPAAALAQAYPAKPVRWVIPFPPGGGTDLISRTLTQKLSEAWGVQVIADNRPGAGGTIGMNIAAKSPGDGYTIVLGQAGNIAVAPALYAKLPYDPLKDVMPVTQVVAPPLVVVSHPSFPAKDIRGLIAAARAKPGAITYGSPGNGLIGHLALEMLKSMTRVDMVHIPYTGAARALTELIGGQIVVYASSMPPAVPMIKAGRLKALAVTSAKRIAAMPEVPAVSETIPGYAAVNWYGVFVPAVTPREIVARLNEDIVKILRQPDVRQRFASEGGEAVGDTTERFAAFVRAEIPKWAKVVKDSGAKVD